MGPDGLVVSPTGQIGNGVCALWSCSEGVISYIAHSCAASGRRWIYLELGLASEERCGETATPVSGLCADRMDPACGL